MLNYYMYACIYVYIKIKHKFNVMSKYFELFICIKNDFFPSGDDVEKSLCRV